MRAGELRGILGERYFRRLYATRLVSQLTDGVFQVALAGYVFFSPERQASAAKAAAAFAVTLLPYSALGPFAGVFLDRWRRRQILVWAPVLRAAVVLLVAVMVGVDEDGLPFFIGGLVVLGVNRFFLAALSAALPHVVRREQLVTANAFAVTSGTIAAFAGGGLAYLLRGAFGGGPHGTASILVVAAVLFLAAGALAALLPRDLLGPHAGETSGGGTAREVLHGLVDGARHIVRLRPAGLALGAISFHRFLYGVVLMQTLLLCRGHFTGNAEDGLRVAAVMLGVTGAGYFAAAVITPAAVRRITKPAWISLLLAGGGAVVLVLGLPFAEAPWAAMSFALGVSSQGVKLCVDTILQETVEDAYRGRVFAVYDMLFNAAFAASAALAASWLPVSGVSSGTVVGVAAVYVLGALIYRTASNRVPVIADAPRNAA
ncbi:MFS transporter [Actinomadura rupiterrae]|uniref:MFS transporter n=1 Tax=Actinomadura rupiterrae TaxID=559627 RepID=UPI0020A282D9|nr:MFS transporter [Actinomadura rupiterrae]MCP2340541.1 MFS family permease [Actinomadura rupiterrae]